MEELFESFVKGDHEKAKIKIKEALDLKARELVESGELYIKEHLSEYVLDEAIRRKVNFLGKLIRRKKCPEGYVLVDGKCKKQKADTKRKLHRIGKKSAKKRKRKQARINIRTDKAKAKRKQKGL